MEPIGAASLDTRRRAHAAVAAAAALREARRSMSPMTVRECHFHDFPDPLLNFQNIARRTRARAHGAHSSTQRTRRRQRPHRTHRTSQPTTRRLLLLRSIAIVLYYFVFTTKHRFFENSPPWCAQAMEIARNAPQDCYLLSTSLLNLTKTSPHILAPCAHHHSSITTLIGCITSIGSCVRHGERR